MGLELRLGLGLGLGGGLGLTWVTVRARSRSASACRRRSRTLSAAAAVRTTSSLAAARSCCLRVRLEAPLAVARHALRTPASSSAHGLASSVALDISPDCGMGSTAACARASASCASRSAVLAPAMPMLVRAGRLALRRAW